MNKEKIMISLDLYKIHYFTILMHLAFIWINIKLCFRPIILNEDMIHINTFRKLYLFAPYTIFLSSQEVFLLFIMTKNDINV